MKPTRFRRYLTTWTTLRLFTFAVYGKDLKLMDVKITDLREEFLKIVSAINRQEEVGLEFNISALYANLTIFR